VLPAEIRRTGRSSALNEPLVETRQGCRRRRACRRRFCGEPVRTGGQIDGASSASRNNRRSSRRSAGASDPAKLRQRSDVSVICGEPDRSVQKYSPFQRPAATVCEHGFPPRNDQSRRSRTRRQALLTIWTEKTARRSRSGDVESEVVDAAGSDRAAEVDFGCGAVRKAAAREAAPGDVVTGACSESKHLARGPGRAPRVLHPNRYAAGLARRQARRNRALGLEHVRSERLASPSSRSTPAELERGPPPFS
jgi:hypothetical protein